MNLTLAIAAAFLAAEPEITVLPRDPVALAMADLQTQSPETWPCLRYVWIPEGGEIDCAAVKFAAHSSVSRAAYLFPIWSSEDNKLVRLDFDQLAGGDRKVRDELLDLWDKLAEQDRTLYVDINAAVPVDAVPVKADRRDPAGSKRYRIGDVLWFVGPTGNAFRLVDGKWVAGAFPKAANRYAFGPHLFDLIDGEPDYSDGAVLQRLCDTDTPVCHYRHFVTETMSTLDGGLYYDFTGIKASPNDDQTDFEFTLEQFFGVDLKAIERLRADRRAAFFQSGVTGKPRVVMDVRAPTGLVTWTEDYADEAEQDAKKHPLQNLAPPVPFDASELIGIRANGMQLYVLFDGQGKLAEEVPPNIAMDHSIPPPYTSRLVPGTSCISCHGPTRGFITVGNDALDILRGGEGLLKPDVLDFDRERLDRIAGLYQDSTQRLNDGRRDYSIAVKQATGQGVVAVCAEVQAIRDEYRYSTVDAVRALREVGVQVEGKEAAVALLRELIPGVPGVREDVRVIGLKAGKSITATDFLQVYADVAFRVRTTLLERGMRQ